MLLVLWLHACSHPVPPAAPGPAAEAPAAEAAVAVAPHPHTLEQLRASLPSGSRIRLRFEAAGQPTVEERWDFSDSDETGTTFHSEVWSEAGELLKDDGSARVTWAELYGHADFPAADTVRSESSVEVPAGRFDTWLYTVQEKGDDGVAEVHRYHFAKTMPGPPVLFTIERGGAEVFRMTMLERTTP